MWQWLLRVADVRAIWRHYGEASNSWSRRGDGGPVLAGGPVILRRLSQQDLHIKNIFYNFKQFYDYVLKIRIRI
jgi:hypothetical protein